MNEITKQKIREITESMQKTFEMLWGRWQDEKEYENWVDYETHFKKIFNAMIKTVPAKNAVFIKANKRPFSITYEFEGWRIVLAITAREYRWTAKQLQRA